MPQKPKKPIPKKPIQEQMQDLIKEEIGYTVFDKKSDLPLLNNLALNPENLTDEILIRAAQLYLEKYPKKTSNLGFFSNYLHQNQALAKQMGHGTPARDAYDRWLILCHEIAKCKSMDKLPWSLLYLARWSFGASYKTNEFLPNGIPLNLSVGEIAAQIQNSVTNFYAPRLHEEKCAARQSSP